MRGVIRRVVIYSDKILMYAIILLILLRLNNILKCSKNDMIDSQLSILGKPVELVKRSADSLKGINMGEKLSFDFFDGLFKGVDT